MLVDYKLSPAGDSAIKIKLDDTICFETNKRVHYLAGMLSAKKLAGIVEVVPSYHTLTVYYQPELTTYVEMHKAICRFIEKELIPKQVYQSEIINIPILYGEKVGMDLSKVAEFNYLSDEDVIEIHSNTTYFIYLIGFLPGFSSLSSHFKKRF
jgi:inhibitor of KinA